MTTFVRNEFPNAKSADYGMYGPNFGNGVDRDGFTETDSNRGSFQVGYFPQADTPAPLDDEHLADVPADLSLAGTPPAVDQVDSDYNPPSATV